MKHILPVLALLCLCAGSCSNSQDPNPALKNRGLITGPDYRKCAHPCCGGWFIEIDGNRYRFFDLPAGSDVRLSETDFPIPVRLSWSRSTESHTCYGDVIVIHAIARE